MSGRVENKLIEKWLKLSAKGLTNELEKAILNVGENFVDGYRALYKYYPFLYKDYELSKRIEKALYKLADKYISPETRGVMEEWGAISDVELKDRIAHLVKTSGKVWYDQMAPFFYDAGLKAKVSKCLGEIRSQHEKEAVFELWGALSDEDLEGKIIKELSEDPHSGSYRERFLYVYREIRPQALKKRIDKILMKLASQISGGELEAASEYVWRALYVCAEIRLPDARALLIKLIERIEDPTKIASLKLLDDINEALSVFPINESREFLVRQLEGIPPKFWGFLNNPKLAQHADYRKYCSLMGAYDILKKIDGELAERYWEKLMIMPYEA